MKLGVVINMVNLEINMVNLDNEVIKTILKKKN